MAATASVQPYLLIGNPGNKRTLGLQAARQKLGLPPAIVLPYSDLLNRSIHLGESIRQAATNSQPLEGKPIIIRLEAPGENPLVERELIAWGAEFEGSRKDLTSGLSVTAAKALRLPEEYGRILYPGQWYRGYCRLLAELREAAQQSDSPIRWVNDPADVAVMFDKRRCQQLLSQNGVPTPAMPAPAGSIRDYESLLAAVQSSRMNRLFIKLAYGSGASGIIAYQRHPVTGSEIAITTIGVEQHNDEQLYYNSGKLQRYTDHATIRLIIDWLCREGAQIERWIEKDSIDGSSYDIRQLVVNGSPCHALARLSRTPITNLHLRNERRLITDGMLSAILKEQVEHTAVSALAAFNGSTVAGIDVLVQKKRGLTYICDVNPFGDLLYHAEHKGMNTYEWQMSLLQQ
ncbi:Glutathione synthase/RimK-type ligase, ATP-grasp superfamily [Paenibacillus algorifonticola]|uniref:Glutathione synthase/RimK-type ligase, ATP-grasp superfamily n=1 Tax=Paenibacillus algorifonticola TaxID=684063 RepID=A0A1I2HER3_9BACL|nr:STM4014 family protein [Paenibacillus algorifonticola]SFF28674.1 Glutathione synthase/RimK-type ligase, ATP-grasp superfamily [Paenibacillus algorifonticola]